MGADILRFNNIVKFAGSVFENTHRGRVCVRVFIEKWVRRCECLYVLCNLKKNWTSPSLPFDDIFFCFYAANRLTLYAYLNDAILVRSTNEKHSMIVKLLNRQKATNNNQSRKRIKRRSRRIRQSLRMDQSLPVKLKSSYKICRVFAAKSSTKSAES